jgi:hypothetical protein
VADAYYCKECVKLEKDRDGCPKIINLGSARPVRASRRPLPAAGCCCCGGGGGGGGWRCCG